MRSSNIFYQFYQKTEVRKMYPGHKTGLIKALMFYVKQFPLRLVFY